MSFDAFVSRQRRIAGELGAEIRDASEASEMAEAIAVSVQPRYEPGDCVRLDAGEMPETDAEDLAAHLSRAGRELRAAQRIIHAWKQAHTDQFGPEKERDQ